MLKNICLSGKKKKKKKKKRLPRGYFFFFVTDLNSQSILHLLSVTPSIQDFSRVKSDCFAITHFSLHSYRGNKFLKFIPFFKF